MPSALSGEIGRGGGGGWGLTLDWNIWTIHPAARRAHWQLFSSETGRDVVGVNCRYTHTHRVKILLPPRWPNLHSCDRSPTVYLSVYMHKYVYGYGHTEVLMECKLSLSCVGTWQPEREREPRSGLRWETNVRRVKIMKCEQWDTKRRVKCCGELRSQS